MTQNENKKLVLHICCAVCGAYLCELLRNQFQEIILYFYNPNIWPKEEYERRKQSVQKLAEIYNLEFMEGDYDSDNWSRVIKGLENEPEGGKRCPICFEVRLRKTAEIAGKKNFGHFATTLAISPYKSEKIVDEIGNKLAGELNLSYLSTYIMGDLNKNEIWQKTRELAKRFEFYHQKYCGCNFSVKK